MIDTEKRPVLAGLVALATVAVVFGVLGGLFAAFGVKVAGIGEGGGGSGSSGEAAMYIPEPTETESETAQQQPQEQEPSNEPSESEAPQKGINLTVGQSSVAPMQQIDLTGTYPTGEGSVLQVQRFEGGGWADFPVTMSVSGQTFSTYVMTGRLGVNRFRVIDTDSKVASNPVRVTVG
ncbi:MAG: hypothetical protein LT071_09615 [Nocardioides sp.]|nr:hypothetical protein [Nocardioides sp.]